MKRVSKAVTAACLIAMSAAATQAQAPYKVFDRWKIGGTGGWDYLLADGPAHRL